MLIELALNELSLMPPAHSDSVARQWIGELVETLQAAVEYGVNSTLRTNYLFADDLVLAPRYTLGSWFNDGRIDYDVRTYLLTFSTQKPYLADRPEDEKQSQDFILYWDRKPGEGLLTAYLLNGLAISVNSAMAWNNSALLVELYWLENRLEKRQAETLHHASQPVHIAQHSVWIQQRLKESVKTGIEIWERRVEFWGSLAFCEAVEEQSKNLPTEALSAILRGLFCLETYNRQWTEGMFNPRALSCVSAPESDSTLREYGAERTFRCPDGQKRVFLWHLKLGNWRIHFYHDLPGQIIVGYIGKHLRTALFH